MSQFPWHPTNAFGNSLADPRVQRNKSQNFVSASNWQTIGIHAWREWRTIKQSQVNSKLDDASFLYDLSYESNFALWDKYFLSTVKADYVLGTLWIIQGCSFLAIKRRHLPRLLKTFTVRPEIW